MQPTPSRRRRVAAASAPSSAIESGRGLAPRLSPTQTEPKSGSASAFAASASISATVVTPKTTPRWGRVKPNPGAAPGMSSVEDDSAVDVEGLAGDVARTRRGQEHGQGRDVLGVVRPPQRNVGIAPPLHLLDRHALFLRPAGQVVVRQRGDGGARADRVDVDVVAGELER